uniref:RING-type domain-containing protein n=1 Tax=Syphacia muris TaxID=451379 RepID=A0A0N5B0W1_9BILA
MDCVVAPQPSRPHRKKRVADIAETNNHYPLFEPELVDVEEHEEDSNSFASHSSESDRLQSHYVTLQFSKFPSEKLRIQDILLRRKPIDGIFPSTYCVRVDNSNFHDSRLPLPDRCKGHLIIQRLTEYTKNVRVRCILNPGTPIYRRPEFVSVMSVPFPVECRKKFDAANLSAQVKCIDDGAERLEPVLSELGTPGDVSLIDLKTCPICCEANQNCIALRCQHFFCELCWSSYVKACINAGNLPIQCMEPGCSTVMEPSQMLVILPFETCRRCEMLAKQSALHKKLKGSRWFKCESCGRINKITTSNSENIFAACHCGFLTCLLCLKSAHFPLKCKDAEAYRDVSDSANVEGYLAIPSVSVRQCPHCGIFCEKSYGCNHMICNCGREFCYNCCRDYVNAGNHNSCEQMEFGFTALEYTCVLAHFKRRQLSKTRKVGALAVAQNIRFKLCDMQKRCDKIQFHMARLEQLCECKRMNWHKLVLTVERAERTLTRAIMYNE